MIKKILAWIAGIFKKRVPTLPDLPEWPSDEAPELPPSDCQATQLPGVGPEDSYVESPDINDVLDDEGNPI